MLRSVLIASMLVAVTAHADDVVAYEAEGDAAAAGADPRVAALDDAFGRAVQSALADLVDGDARVAHKGELDREIVGHARLWVKSYAVTRDETNDDRRQLVVSVRIDRDKLRARLGELGIATKQAAEPPPEAPTARPIVVLLRVATPHGVRADYGEGADKDTPGVAAITAALRNAGFAVRRAPATGRVERTAAAGKPGDRGDAGADLPLSDDEADALATEAKGDLALVAGVTLGVPIAARGIPAEAAIVTAHVRLVDHKKAVAQGGALAGARGEDATSYAIDRALTAALADVLPPAPKQLAQAGSFQGDDAPIGEPGIVLVRLPTSTPWRLVLEEQKYLAGAKGVRAATLRRLSPRGWVIGVATSEPNERVAQIARHAPTADSTANVKIADGIVEVSLTGAP